MIAMYALLNDILFPRAVISFISSFIILLHEDRNSYIYSIRELGI